MTYLQTLLKDDYRKWKDRDYCYVKKDGAFRPMTFGHFLRYTDRFVKFLKAEGYDNKNIMIYSENSIDWMVADLAIVGFVGVAVGVPAVWKTDDVDNEIEHLGISLVLYSEAKKDMVAPLIAKYPGVSFLQIETATESDITDYDDSDLFDFEARDENLCAKIVFSSGTTSFPKAVMLSQKNIFAGVASLLRRCPFDESDSTYCFLPFSHTYGGIYNFYYSLVCGYRIYLTCHISEIATEIREANPTIFCAVPLILYRFLEGYGPDKIMYAFGSNIKYIFVGGADFKREVKALFKEKGLNLLEAYALSETASSFAIEYSGDKTIEGTGTVFEELTVEVRNPDENGIGEIYCKGDAVFLGYMNEPTITESVLSKDGWFKTGDLGRMDEDRRLFITGRSKKVLIGANGELINDEKIREQIKQEVANVALMKLFLYNDKLTLYVYVPDEETLMLDWAAIVTKLNNINSKNEEIKQFKVFLDTPENRLK